MVASIQTSCLNLSKRHLKVDSPAFDLACCQASVGEQGVGLGCGLVVPSLLYLLARVVAVYGDRQTVRVCKHAGFDRSGLCLGSLWQVLVSSSSALWQSNG